MAEKGAGFASCRVAGSRNLAGPASAARHNGGPECPDLMQARSSRGRAEPGSASAGARRRWHCRCTALGVVEDGMGLPELRGPRAQTALGAAGRPPRWFDGLASETRLLPGVASRRRAAEDLLRSRQFAADSRRLNQLSCPSERRTLAWNQLTAVSVNWNVV